MSSESSDLTPMLRQYREIKEQYPDAILMYRIGDFYEMFFEDALQASRILDIVLTSRNKNDEHPIPLCGVPYHSVQPYISKLIEAGHKVAICDQVEDPKQAKGVVRREVTRVITPGLRIDPETPKQSCYLASLCPGEKRWGFAFVELSTGEFQTTELEPEEVIQELQVREVRELLLPENFQGQLPKVFVAKLASWIFDETYARRLLLDQFRVATLAGFGCEGLSRGISAAGAILHYIRETQKVSSLPHLTLRKYERGDRLLFSRETARSLDLDRLVALLDKTETAMGGRLLREWVFHPLTDRKKIEARLEGVEEFLHKSLANGLRESLQNVYDLERIAGKLSLETAHPRDLVALAKSLRQLETMTAPLGELVASRLKELASAWDSLPEVAERIEKTLLPDPPPTLTEGGIIAETISPLLGELRETRRNAQKYLASVEDRERERTGIHSLKIRFHKVFGYSLEVTAANLSKVPADYVRKQTLANAERYLTPELKELEGKILGAEEKIRSLEYDLFCDLRRQVKEAIPRIQAQAVRVAELDVMLSLARVASEFRYVRPEIRAETGLEIEAGRHPLVEFHLPPGRFVANDLSFGDQQRLLLITGPNMAGKSTLIRQVGLIVLLAQLGSFVPARRAVVGIVDRLFSRIGASDHLVAGESTFMVEMTETASLLHAATERSLILLDEIGRGTATFDGLSIAWAVAEYLHDKIRARTLFATHYHELIDLALTRPGIKNYHVAVKEEGEEIVFLYRLIPGGMNHSYGIHVARLAGLPEEVLSRAQEVLGNLEQGELTPEGKPRLGKKNKKHEGQSSLF